MCRRKLPKTRRAICSPDSVPRWPCRQGSRLTATKPPWPAVNERESPPWSWSARATTGQRSRWSPWGRALAGACPIGGDADRDGEHRCGTGAEERRDVVVQEGDAAGAKAERERRQLQPLRGDAALQLGGPVAACAQGLEDWLEPGAVKDGRGRIAAQVLPQAERVGAAPLRSGSKQLEIALAPPKGPWRQRLHRVHGHQMLQQRRPRWDEVAGDGSGGSRHRPAQRAAGYRVPREAPRRAPAQDHSLDRVRGSASLAGVAGGKRRGRRQGWELAGLVAPGGDRGSAGELAGALRGADAGVASRRA